MEADFWHDKWASNQIGFHEPEPHPMLVQWWPQLGLAADCRVFVPLCGKSNDLAWLRARGCDVVGVEISEIAVAAFFAEQGLEPARREQGALDVYHAHGYTLYCGDFFALDRGLLGDIDAVYDRAALIALPQAMRAAYAEHLCALAPAGTGMLLVTVGYDEDVVRPPPFVVTDDEVAALYAGDWRVTRLGDAAAEVKGEAGTETAWHLVRETIHAG